MPRNLSHILVGVVYHPPGACEFICTKHIISSIDEIMKKHPYTVVMLLGDFKNLNDNQLRSYPLKQVVRMATRRSVILDEIFTNIHSLYNPPKVLPPSSFSDHNVVLYEPAKSYRYNAGKLININTRLSGPKAKEKFSTALASFDWTPLYLQPSCGQKFEFFQNSMTCLTDLHLPKRCVRRHPSDKPWVTDYFRQLIRQRQRAFLSGNFILYRRLATK